MHDDFYDPVYKGCTAPSTILGVPLIPFVLGALVIAQISVLSFFFIRFSVALSVVVVGLVLYFWARRTSMNDEHRLLQQLMRLRMRAPQQATRKFWGAVSFSPLPPRK